jgi:hypothetical protein
MSLNDWAKAGWVKPHLMSRQQITELFSIVDRDLEDAAQGLSADWQFGIAYNAALKLCTILLYAEGCPRHATWPKTRAAVPAEKD